MNNKLIFLFKKIGRFTTKNTIVVFFLTSLIATNAYADEWVWEEVTPTVGDAAEIKFSRSNPEVVYLGVQTNAHTFYRSDDAGETWNNAFRFTHTADFIVHPNDPNTVYLGLGGQVYKTTVGEKTPHLSGTQGWNKIFAQTGPGRGPDKSISSMDIDANDSTKMLLTIRGSLADDPTGTDAKLFITEDSGATWTKKTVPSRPLYVAAFSLKDSNTIFLGAANGIYKSQDQGQSWNKVSDTPEVTSFAVLNKVILATSAVAGILKSDDDGDSWVISNTGLPTKKAERIKSAESNSNILYITTDDGIFRSDDFGTSWRTVSESLPVKNLQALAIHPKNPDTVLVSTESFIFSVRGEKRFRYNLLAGQGIYKTVNAGHTWKRVGIEEFDFEFIVANPFKPYEFWSSTLGSIGLLTTGDGGQTWFLSPTLVGHYPMYMSFKSGKKSIFSGIDSVSHYDDSGAKVKEVKNTEFFSGVNRGKEFYKPSGIGLGEAIHVHGIAVKPGNENIVFAGSVHDPLPYFDNALKGAHIFKSEDGGLTWRESDEGFEHEAETSIYRIVFDPTNGDIIYVATSSHESITGNGLWRSTDSGKTWHKIKSLNSDDVRAVIINPENSKNIIVGTKDGVFYSESSGENWKKTFNKHVFDAVYDKNDNTIYLAAEDGLYTSNVFGKSWKLLKSFAGKVKAIAVDASSSILMTGIEDIGVFAGYRNGIKPQKVELSH